MATTRRRLLRHVSDRVFQDRLKDALNRATVAPDVIERILLEESNFIQVSGRVITIAHMVGQHLSVTIDGWFEQDGFGKHHLAFSDSDFSSEEARNLREDLISEARRANSHKLTMMIVGCYIHPRKPETWDTLQVAKIRYYMCENFWPKP